MIAKDKTQVLHAAELPMAQGTVPSVSFTLNGEPFSLNQTAPDQTLLEYLRHSGRIGTKEGCGDGDCGACTVVLISADAEGVPQYTAVNSCLLPLGALAGREVLTVEGIGAIEGKGQDGLHPVQTAMVQTGGSQCGYCTPGFIMSLFAAYYNGSVDDLCVEGNLCRCTGYLAIRRAAQQIVQERQIAQERHITQESAIQAERGDRFTHHLATTTATLPAVAYQGLDHKFYRPTQLAEVLTLLADFPQATLLAGATDLGLEMSHHRHRYPILISLEAVAELHGLRITSEAVEIGAAVPLSHLETQLHGIFPSLDEMLHWFAARQVRNRATLGGNIGTASPIGDLPPVLLALDADVTLAGPTGDRTLPLVNFFTGYRQTVRQPGEVIVSISIPRAIAPTAVRRLSQSYKIGKRGTDDISIVAAAFTIDLDADNRVVQARLAYGGVAATPVRAIAIEQQLVGQPWTHTTIHALKPALRDVFTPLSDLRGSADYRRLLVANLFEKFFVEMEMSV